MTLFLFRLITNDSRATHLIMDYGMQNFSRIHFFWSYQFYIRKHSPTFNYRIIYFNLILFRLDVDGHERMCDAIWFLIVSQIQFDANDNYHSFFHFEMFDWHDRRHFHLHWPEWNRFASKDRFEVVEGIDEIFWKPWFMNHNTDNDSTIMMFLLYFYGARNRNINLQQIEIDNERTMRMSTTMCRWSSTLKWQQCCFAFDYEFNSDAISSRN